MSALAFPLEQTSSTFRDLHSSDRLFLLNAFSLTVLSLTASSPSLLSCPVFR